MLQSPEDRFADEDEDMYQLGDSAEAFIKRISPEGYGSSQASIHQQPPPTPDSAIPGTSSIPPSIASPSREKGKGRAHGPKRQRTSQSRYQASEASSDSSAEPAPTKASSSTKKARTPAKKAARNKTEQKSRRNRSGVGKQHLAFAVAFQDLSPGFLPNTEFKGAADGEKYTLRAL